MKKKVKRSLKKKKKKQIMIVEKTRLLKSNQVNIKDRLKLAIEFLDPATYLPNKHEFLMDWIVTLMVKSVDRSPTEDICHLFYLNSDCWTFLDQLMSEIHARGLEMQSRMPIIGLVPAVLKFSLANTDHANLIHVVNAARRLFHNVTTGSWTHITSVSLEQNCQIAMECLDAFVELCNSSQNPLFDSQLKLIMEVVAQMQAEQSKSQNIKKMLSFSLQNVLPRLTTLFHLCFLAKTEVTALIKEQINGLLTAQFEKVLFHEANLPEFASMLSCLEVSPETQPLSISNTKSTSYTFALFSTLSESLGHGTETYSATLRVLPILFESFCAVFKAKGKQAQFTTSCFAFFVSVCRLMEASYSDQESSDEEQLLDCTASLLDIVVRFDLFRPTHEGCAVRQRLHLQNMTSKLITLASDPSTAAVMRETAFQCLGRLMKLDHTLITDQMDKIWVIVFGDYPDETSANRSKDSLLTFMLDVLNIHVKARQLDVMVRVMIESVAIEGAIKDSVVMREEWLEEFGKLLASMLFAQSSQIIDILKLALIEASEFDETHNERIKKRRIDSVETPIKYSKSPAKANLISSLLSIGIVQLTRTDSPSAFIESLQLELNDSFIKPFFKALKKSEDHMMDEKVCVAVLRVYWALMTCSTTFAENHAAIKTILKLRKYAILYTETSPSIHSWIICIFATYLTLEVKPSFALTESCQDISVVATELMAMVSLPEFMSNNEEQSVIDSWDSLIRNLPSITAVLSKEVVEKLVEALIVSLEHGSTSSKRSVSNLTRQIIASADFYEIWPIRNSFLRVFCSRVRYLVKHAFDKHSPVVSAALKIIKSVEKEVEEQSFCLKDIIPMLDHLLATPNQQSTEYLKVDIDQIHRLSRLFSALDSFPALYFQKEEHHSISVVAFVVDWITSKAFDSSSIGPTCRSILLRYISISGDHMLTIYDPNILLFLLSRSSTAMPSDATCIDDAEKITRYNESTLQLTEISIKKGLKLINGAFPRGSKMAPLVYIETVLDVMTTKFDDMCYDYVACMVNCLVSELFVPNRAKAGSALLASDSLKRFLDKLDKCSQEWLESHHSSNASLNRVIWSYFMFIKQHNPDKFHEFVQTISTNVPRHGSDCSFDLETLAILLECCSEMDDSFLDEHLPKWLQAVWNLNVTGSDTDQLATAITHFAQTCSVHTYELAAQLQLQAFYERSIATTTQSSIDGLLFFSHRFLTTFNENAGSSHLRTMFPMILTMCARMISETKSIATTKVILDITNAVVTDKYLHLSSHHVSLVIGVVDGLSLNNELQTESEQTLCEMYENIYSIIHGLLKYRRNAVIHVIPLILSHIYSLLSALRERPKLQLSNLRRRQTNQQQRSMMHNEFPLFSKSSQSIPLKCVQHAARLLIAMTEKPAVSNNNSGVSTDMRSGESIDTMHSKLVKPFSKHAPFILSRIVSIQASARPFCPAVKAEIREGIYAILDICNDHGRESVFAGGEGGLYGERAIFIDFVTSWQKEHRYKGEA